jgi:hypothetical protein
MGNLVKRELLSNSKNPQKMNITRNEQGNDTCAICLTENISCLRMSCCYREGSDLVYCLSCLHLLAHEHSRSIGKCPTCRKEYQLQLDNDGNFIGMLSGSEIPKIMGTCMYCRQHRELGSQSRKCEKCELGSQYNFAYQCNTCQGIQRIPHPMWIYQASPNDFSGASWFCHQGCSEFTHWKLVDSELGKIPHAHIPEGEGWNGVRQRVFERIRAAARER